MTTTSPDRAAFYKSLRLGDLVHGPDALTVPGEDVGFKAPLYGTRGTFNDRGSSSRYELEVTADMLRNYYADSETTDAFERRRLLLMSDIRKVRGYATGATTTSGILSIIDNATEIRTTTGDVTAGSTVGIAYSGSEIASGATAGSLWLLASNTGSMVHEIVVATGAHTGATITATTLVNDFASGSTIAPVLWYIPSVFLMAGSKIPVDEPAGYEACRDISFSFQGVDDAVYYGGTLAHS